MSEYKYWVFKYWVFKYWVFKYWVNEVFYFALKMITILVALTGASMIFYTFYLLVAGGIEK